MCVFAIIGLEQAQHSPSNMFDPPPSSLLLQWDQKPKAHRHPAAVVQKSLAQSGEEATATSATVSAPNDIGPSGSALQ